MKSEILKNWENLFVPEPVLQAIEKEGFLNPTDIQKLVLPCAIRDRMDILGAAATGTGKTLAFGIPMISRILMDRQKEIDAFEMENDLDDGNDDVDMDSEVEDDEQCNLSPSESELEETWNDEDIKPNCFVGVEMYRIKENKCKPYEHIYGLVLTPTRELACQVTDHLKKACQFTDLKICSIFGGMSAERQERLLNKKPEIVVVTPGRFWAFIQDQEPHALSASKLSVLVIDEADRMLEKGHFAEIDNLMNWFKINSSDRFFKGIPMKPRQTLVFSATLTFVHSTKNDNSASLKKKFTKITKNDKLKNFITKLGMSEQPKIIDTTIDVAQLSQWKILCPTQEDKDTRIYWFLKNHPGRTIVFANSKNSVRRLTSVLQTLGLSPKSLMADMQQKMRLKKLESFSKIENGILIASDVAARGLDIPKIDFVIHFDVAHTAETHLHRSGRTARALKPGHSVIMLTPGEVGQLNKILFSLKKTETDIKDVQIKNIEYYEEIVKLAREIESKSHIVKTGVNNKNWFEKMAEKADIALDDDIVEVNKRLSPKKNNREMQKKSEMLNDMIKQLEKVDSDFVSPIPEYVSVGNDLQSDPIAIVTKFQSDSSVGKKKRNNKRKPNVNDPIFGSENHVKPKKIKNK